jgi:NAD(P)-dependent dehydrogenase (short-subunit alcohol dehydrogenase family)
MPRDLSGAVVVITGASSGIGRAAAAEFAAAGARLVLAAREAQPLEVLAGECGDALAVPTDVRDEEAVDALADAAVERYGRLDVWVNGAGVMAYGDFEQIPAEDFRAILETNLFGQVHGARAALRCFRAQGDGVLVNMSSVWGRVTTPGVSAYVTSKFAVRAFGECLRHELRDEPRISVATMLPAAVDTPIFQHAGNYSGRRVRPIAPVVDPKEVARGIVACARDPKREVTYGRVARLLEFLHSLAPGVYHRFAGAAFEAGNYADAPARPGAGNVAAPLGPYAVYGGWKSAHNGRELRRAALAAALGGARGLLGIERRPGRGRGQ